MEICHNFEKISELCRTCFREEINLKNIHDYNITIENNSTTVLEMLNLVLKLEFTEEYPNNICECCIDKLTQIYKFKLQCESSNNLFLKYINSVKHKDSIKKDNGVDIAKEHCYIEHSPNHLEDEEEVITHFENSHSDVKEKNKKPVKSTTNKFSCVVCGEYFKTKKLLLVHKKEQCDDTFSSPAQLKQPKSEDSNNSIESNIDDKNEEISQLSCSKCRKTFKSKYTLFVHQKRHTLRGHFLCTTCGKGFNARGCLNRHMRVHTGEKKYECSVCHKKFPSSNNLNLHFRIHSGEKPYLCTVCGKSFSHPTGLTYHLRTHTKERKYKCNFCSKAFAVQCHLDNHKKIHTGERPHACKQCDRAFIKKVDLQRHELTHSGVKPFVCTVCDKEFLRPLHLNYHMMIHTAERPHRCSYCGKGFIRRYYLKDHILKHHGIKESKTEEDDEGTVT